MMPVLDASALLALLFQEEGAEEVERAISGGARICAINLTETLTRFADRGQDPLTSYEALREAGLVGQLVEVTPFDEQMALRAAQLRKLTREKGLSLGDRACLALAAILSVPVLTADRDWADLDVGVEIRLVR